jgi:hypothetical protein
MKKISLICLLLVITGSGAASSDAQWGVFFGFGAEANGNTYEGAAAGGVYCMGIDFNRFAVGVKTFGKMAQPSTANLMDLHGAGLLIFHV